MYGFDTTVQGELDEVVEKVTEALKDEGFGVLMTLEIDQALREKIGVERRPYRILGACDPRAADQALQLEPNLGLLLPCNVIVREDDDGKIVVGFMDPEAVLKLVGRPELDELGAEVKQRLLRVRDAL